MLTRVLPIAIILAAFAFAACVDDSGPTTTPRPMTRGPALQVFLREAYKVDLFREGDPVEIAVEDMLYDDAARAARELGLGLYATAPGGPPYDDGLPGFFISVQGDFFDHGAADGDVAPRRPGVAAAFVDTKGRFTYTWRFVE